MHPEADVGGDEAAAGDEREGEAGRDHPFGPLAVHDHPRVVRRQALNVHPGGLVVGLGGHGGRVAVLGHRGRSEQARRGRGSADHPVRRSRDPSTLGALGLFHVAHDYFCTVPFGPVGLGSRRFAVIHSAMITRKPSPPRKITRPSVTGPVRPREKPPGLGSTRVCVM